MKQKNFQKFALPVVLLYVALLYIPSLYNGFTTWDDPLHILENPAIKSLDIKSVLALFIPSVKYMYHPLTMISFAIDWFFGGDHPLYYHATNYFLHLSNVALVYLLINKIAQNRTTAFLTALIFGIHPFNVETVAWISARKDILFSFFFLLGLTVYLRYKQKRNFTLLLFVFFCYIFGLLAKPTMVIFPAALLLVEWMQEGLSRKTLRPIILIFFTLSFLYGIFTFLLSSSDTSVDFAILTYSLPQRILLIVYSFTFYFLKIFFPVSLSAVYSYPVLITLKDYLPITLTILTALGAMLILYFAARKKYQQELVFAVVVYSLPLIFVTQVLPFHNSSVTADHYGYLSSIGVIFFILFHLEKYFHSDLSAQKIHLALLRCFQMLVIVVFSLLTLQRIAVWKEGKTLFTDVIEKNNSIWLAYNNRANAEIQLNEFKNSILDCDTALTLNPYNGKIYYNRGNARSYLGEYAAAISDYDSAISLGFSSHLVFYNKGIAYTQLHRADSALLSLHEAIKRDSTFAQAYFSLGFLFLDALHKPNDAIKYFTTALRYNPVYREALYQRSAAYTELNEPWNALQDLVAYFSLNEGTQRNVPLAKLINRSLDSLNGELIKLDDAINQKIDVRNNYFRRSKIYFLLGDSTRSQNDLLLARSMKKP